MLVASAKHPAMLSYLDNASSDKDAPNENYAPRAARAAHRRRRRRLHRERMVKSAARLLTGMSRRGRRRATATSTTRRSTPPGRCGSSASPTRTARRTARRSSSATSATWRTTRRPRGGSRTQARGPVRQRRAPGGAGHRARRRSTSSTTPTSAGAAGAVRVPGVPALGRRQGEAAVRGPGLDGACAGHPAAGVRHRRGAAAVLALRRRSATPPLGWHPPDGYPDVVTSWQSAGGTLARWNSHLGLAAGWWPNDLRHPPLACRLRPAHARAPTAPSSTPRPPGSACRSRPTRSARRSARSSARTSAAPLSRRATRPSAGGCPTCSRCCSTAPRRRSDERAGPTGRGRGLRRAGTSSRPGSAGGGCSAPPARRWRSAWSAGWSATPRRPGWRSRARRTPVTCSSCSACAAASTACPPWCRPPTRPTPRARPGIGIPTGALLPLDATFGLHPALAPLKPFWDAGTFGVVHAAGQPDPTRSHFQAMEEMERAAPGSSVRTGWLDRVSSAQGAGRRLRHRRGRRRREPARAHRAGARAAHRLGRRLLAVRCRRRGGAGPLERRAAADAPRAPARTWRRRPGSTLGAARHGGRAAGRRLRAANGAAYPDGDLGVGAARRRAAHQGRRRAAGGHRRLRRLGHAPGARPRSTAAG